MKGLVLFVLITMLLIMTNMLKIQEPYSSIICVLQILIYLITIYSMIKNNEL